MASNDPSEIELREVLERLLEDANIKALRIDSLDSEPGPAWEAHPLGKGSALFLLPHSHAPEPATVHSAIRAIREIQRQSQRDNWPSIQVPSARSNPKEVARQRAHRFLAALLHETRMRGALVCLGGRPLIEAGDLSEALELRLPLVLRQLDAKALRDPRSSHGEILSEDLYLRSFWYGAALVLEGECATPDFLRYRVKAVCRELVPILELIDDEPPKPAKAAPRPD